MNNNKFRYFTILNIQSNEMSIGQVICSSSCMTTFKEKPLIIVLL